MLDCGESDSFLFTSESVGEGHPDKLCDQISDAVLDAFLKVDPDAKVACETAVKSEEIHVFGEIHSVAANKIDLVEVVRNTVTNVGYTDDAVGLDGGKCNVRIGLEEQSPEIANCVYGPAHQTIDNLGAGDQGMMFGYATDETPELMPLTLVLSHRLNQRLAECRRNGTLKWSRPDSKAQVTVEYKTDNGALIPLRVATVVLSAQHEASITLKQLREDLMQHVVKPVIPEKLIDDRTQYFINPSGSFIVGGPQSDAGLTGRKIIVDTYGGWGAHGGGAFSGKDPSKVDRSAAYAARWAAKSLVAAGLCRRCLVQLSYAIGCAEPISVTVFHYGTVKPGMTALDLQNVLLKNFDFRPGHIIRDLNLRKPIYQRTACYGHFGRENEHFTWEAVKPIVQCNGHDNAVVNGS